MSEDLANPPAPRRASEIGELMKALCKHLDALHQTYREYGKVATAPLRDRLQRDGVPDRVATELADGLGRNLRALYGALDDAAEAAQIAAEAVSAIQRNYRSIRQDSDGQPKFIID